jgi:LmbE family N-acetylglucosaminyl deacetylase
LFGPEIIKQVRSEALEAHKLLRVKETFFLEFPAPALDQYPRYKMSNEMAAVIKNTGVDTVYIPHRGDCHKDHAIIHDCAMVACRPLANCKVKHVYAYETLSETEWGEPIAADFFIPVRYNTFPVELFNKKIEAMSCFKSQLAPFPASRSLEALEALAKYRGCTVSAERAEAFEVLREIEC